MPLPQDHTDVIIVSPADNAVTLHLEGVGSSRPGTEEVLVSNGRTRTTFSYQRQLRWTTLNGDDVSIVAHLVFEDLTTVVKLEQKSTPSPSGSTPEAPWGNMASVAATHRVKDHAGTSTSVRLTVSGKSGSSSLSIDTSNPALITLSESSGKVATVALTVSAGWKALVQL